MAGANRPGRTRAGHGRTSRNPATATPRAGGGTPRLTRCRRSRARCRAAARARPRRRCRWRSSGLPRRPGRTARLPPGRPDGAGSQDQRLRRCQIQPGPLPPSRPARSPPSRRRRPGRPERQDPRAARWARRRAPRACRPAAGARHAGTPRPAATQRSSLVRSSAGMAVGTLVSRGTGFLRTLVLAYALGIGALATPTTTPTRCRTRSIT